MKFKKLFEPININNLKIKNRIAMPAVALFYTDDYSFNDRYKAFYRQRAKGGVGLMIIGPVAIDKVGSSPLMPGLFENGQINPIREFIDELQAVTDAKVGIQLMHLGRCANEKISGITPIAPSAIASPIMGTVPRAMTKDDIEAVKETYAAAAIRAKAAGFDFIEVMMAGGYLIGEFLSPVVNHRTDEYGGSPENRMRFGLEVIRIVRASVGQDFALGIRVSGHDFLKGGNTLKESLLFCAEAEKAGVDSINVTGGWHETDVPQVTGDVPPGAYLYLSRAIRSKVKIPVFASNRIGDPMLAEEALRTKAADVICWARPLIADPELPIKIQSGRLDERVPCIGCNQGCLDAIFSGSKVSCTVNPRVGREEETKVREALIKKKIFVAGGGPAGMQFALTASLRGHDVTLFETDKKLGGQVRLIRAIPGKEVYFEAVNSLITRLMHANVKIVMNTLLTPEMISADEPDVFVVATGAKPSIVKIPGSDTADIINAWDVLDGTAWDIGKRVVIIGGGATGCETALTVARMGVPSAEVFTFLAYHSADDLGQLHSLLYDSGREITIVEIDERAANNVGPSTRWVLLKNLRLMGVDIRTKTKIINIAKNSLHVETDAVTESIVADTIIMATGAVPVNYLAKSVPDGVVEKIVIGDAGGIGKISNAIQGGFFAAMRV